MRTMCSREIFTKKCRQQQIFDSDLKGAWHYNHVTFTPIAKNFMLYCRLIYMLSILCVRLTIKVKVGIPESFNVGWYPPKKTGSSHLKSKCFTYQPKVYQQLSKQSRKRLQQFWHDFLALLTDLSKDFLQEDNQSEYTILQFETLLAGTVNTWQGRTEMKRNNTVHK